MASISVFLPAVAAHARTPLERNPLPAVQQQRPSKAKPGAAPVTTPLSLPTAVGRLRPARQWPARTTTTQLVAPGARAAVAGTPVTVSGAAGVDRVQVSVLDHDAALRAGVSAVLLGLQAQSGSRTVAAHGLGFSLSYRAFAAAGGADYGQRLRLVSLPACALTTPTVAACQHQTNLPTSNDSKTETLTARAPLSTTAASPMVVAAVAGASGSNGDFTASSLSPTGTWSAGGSSGGFNYGYPITIPAPATGSDVAPSVGLGYSSSAIDGQIASTNNQSGWAGEGWDYTPGYIERTYRACSDTATAGSPADTGDQCWAGNIVTLNLGGNTTSLVRDDSTGTWHAQDDAGQQAQLLTGAGNGANAGEYWKITTPDGISYVFGRNTVPGGAVQTNSALTVPVYYQNAGDSSCYSSTFANSKCATNLAWRWNLDYVEDTTGNASAYYYTKESGYYGADNGSTAVAYDRAAVLDHIDYGLRDVNGSVAGHPATNRVTFTSAQRCIPNAGFNCDPASFNTANAANWPDTPQDQDCAAPPATCNNHAPTLWSRLRLTQIETSYYTGTGYQPIDTYTLDQSFPIAGDPELELDGITHVGHAAGNSSSPLTQRYIYELLPNRVPNSGSQGDMYFWRLDQVSNELGVSTQVTYGQPNGQDCTASALPADPANDQQLCFPVMWTPLAHTQPILDYFQKYLVTEVVAAPNDNANNSGTGTGNRVTDYDYYGTPAWHADDNEVVKPANRSYGQFRGYARVGVRFGNTANRSNGSLDQQTSSITWYYRGLGGTVGNSLTNDTTADNNEYAGLVRETQTFNGVNGAEVSATITDLATSATTATRARTGLPALTANVVVTAKTRAITDEPGISSSATRTLTSAFAYDSIGRQIQQTDTATDGTPTTCTTTTYATPNSGNLLYLKDRVAEKVVSQQTCPSYGTAPSPVLTDVRTMYDGASTTGGIPSRGLPTEVDTRLDGDPTTAHFGRATATFDTAGRPLSSTQYVDSTHTRTTSTVYTPTLPTTVGTAEPLAGPLTKTVVTNAKSQTVTNSFDPARGLPTEVIDVAGHKTDAEYDALGRTTGVWWPGQVHGTDQASVQYSYLVATAGPSSVTANTLVDTGSSVGYVSTVSLLNSFGEQIQTQQSAPGGSTVTDYVRDSHGWVIDSRNHWYWQNGPSTSYALEADGSAADRTQTSYDGTGRPVLATEYNQLTPTWSTSSVYGGNETTVIPPAGGIAQTTVTNARGWTTALQQYTSPPTVSGSIVTGTHQDTSYGYTALGRQNSMSTPGGSWSYTFDRGGRITKQVDPDTGTTLQTWNDTGELTQTTDAKSQVLTYDYDSLGRKIDEKNGATLLADWTWDTVQAGQLSYTRRYLTSTSIWKVSTDSYDGAGRPLSTTVTQPTTGAEAGFAASYQTSFTYTSTGQVRTMKMPAGGTLPAETLTYTYDSYGNASSAQGLTSIVSAANYAYFGQPLQYQLGVNNQLSSLTYTYDPQTLRLATQRLDTTAVQAQLETKSFNYDASGNLVKSTEQEGNTSAAVETMCYQYTALDQLKQAWSATDGCAADPSTAGNSVVGGPQPYWTSWAYLASGLRTNQVQHGLTAGASDTTTGYTYGVANHADALGSTSVTGGASASYLTDANGNITSRTQTGANLTVGYDKENRTTSIAGAGGSSSYVYDADGNLLIRHDSTTATLYLPGEELTRKNSDNTITGNRFYLFNGTEVAERGSATSANPYFVMADPHGSAQVVAATIAAGIGPVVRRYLDPFGNALGSATGGTWPDSHAFLNKPAVATTAGSGVSAIEDIGAREYDPTTGRFLSADPVVDAHDPQSLNSYDYGDNNPIGNADPSGLHTDGSQYGDREVTYNPDVPAADDPVQNVSPSVSVNMGTATGSHLAKSFTGYAQKIGYQPGYFRSRWANSYSEATAWASFCNTSGSGLCGAYLSNEWNTIANELGALPESVKLQAGLKEDSLDGLGLTQLEVDDGPLGPQIVYRGGGRTNENFTPRPGIDDDGLSTFDSIEAGKAQGVFKPGKKVFVIDTSKFKRLQAFPDEPPPGHVSIRPGNLAEVVEWAATRGAKEAHPLTSEIINAIIGQAKVPE